MGDTSLSADVRLSKYRLALAGAAAGSVVVGLPLILMAARAPSGTGQDGRLAWIWVVLVAVYVLAVLAGCGGASPELSDLSRSHAPGSTA